MSLGGAPNGSGIRALPEPCLHLEIEPAYRDSALLFVRRLSLSSTRHDSAYLNLRRFVRQTNSSEKPLQVQPCVLVLQGLKRHKSDALDHDLASFRAVRRRTTIHALA